MGNSFTGKKDHPKFKAANAKREEVQLAQLSEVQQVSERTATIGGQRVVVRVFDWVDLRSGKRLGPLRHQDSREVSVRPSWLPDAHGRVAANDYVGGE